MLMNTKRNESNILTHEDAKQAGMRAYQAGFSLIEIMVGLVIGLLVTLVIMQVFSVFEGQKRSTTGTADAQTNGNVALYNLQRDIQMAGFGLPGFDKKNSPFQCKPAPSYDDPATPIVEDYDMFPITIVDGGTGSDEVTVRYGDTAMGGGPTKLSQNPAGNTLYVENNMGCKAGDVAIIVFGQVCAMAKVDTVPVAPTTEIKIVPDVGGKVANAAKSDASISCLGNWNSIVYKVNNGMLERTDKDGVAQVAAEIVDIQAQYGLSAVASSNRIVKWENATILADRNTIKAVRIAIVAKNGQLEKENVTLNAPVAWADVAGSPAPVIDLSKLPDWQRYRYRVYETIVPVRNMIWSKSTL